MLAGLFLSLPLSTASDLRVSGSFFSQSASQPVAIRAHRVILRPGEELTDGTILIDRGIIFAVGKDLPVPDQVVGRRPQQAKCRLATRQN